MVETLRGLAAGTITAKAQNHAEASYAPMLKKEDGRIDWKRPAMEIYNGWRGFAPWPGAYTTFRGQTCHVWGEPMSKEGGARLPSGAAPGTLCSERNELFIWCGDNNRFVPSARPSRGAQAGQGNGFCNGARLKSGERFGDS